MRDPGDGTAQQPAETLQVGPARPPVLERLPARSRQPAVAVLGLVLGTAIGAGTVLWWPDRPPPTPVPADEHAVELVLFDAAPTRMPPGRWSSDVAPLRVDGAILLTGGVASTVSRIGVLGDGLEIRTPALPVTVSPTARYESVTLLLFVRDCEAALGWAPGDRPLTISWRDEHGRDHLDRAGDFDPSLGGSLTRHIDAVCATR